MAFDDLAKHMAARDGKNGKLASGPVSAAQFVAEEAIADRRRERTRNLVLGSILLLGGALAWLLFFSARSDPRAAEEGLGRMWMVGAIASGLAIAGLQQVVSGVRNKPHDKPINVPFS